MGSNLSDYNRSRSSTVARAALYSDIDNSFKVHPLYNDIIPITDIDSIRQSLKNLLLVNRHDRLFQPSVASDITALLFENADAFTELELKSKIERVIDLYEPRIIRYSIAVTDDSDRNAYRVTIKFEASYNSTSEFTIFLTRIR